MHVRRLAVYEKTQAVHAELGKHHFTQSRELDPDHPGRLDWTLGEGRALDRFDAGIGHAHGHRSTG